jgi:hypothetical protein
MEKKNLILAGLGLVTLTGIGIGKWLLKKKTKEKQEQEEIEVKTKNGERLSVAKLLDKYNVPKFFGGHDCEDFLHELTNSEIVYTLYVWEDKHGKEWLIPKKFRTYPDDYIEYQGIKMSLEEHDAGLLERYYLEHGIEISYFYPDEDEEETSEVFLGYGICFDLKGDWIQYKTENTTKIYQINEEIHKIFENIWKKGGGPLDILKDEFLEDLESILKKGN